ncbi:MAG: TrkH family potassium uptake protein, partial [Bacteroidaceae bacterium]|nr:TrkH family potassium uptake protein [Bacteroidaceae bacterium]
MGSVPVALYYDEPVMRPLLISIAAMVGVGSLFTYICSGDERNISRKDGYIVVTLCWIIFSLFGSLPYMLTGYIPSFTDAFYETMSGFSTTGATILQDIEALPKSLLFWRMMTHWVGGLGIVFFTVAIFPIFGLSDIHLFAAESVGPMRSKLHPRIAVTARWILTIYVGLTIIATISYHFAGMGWFDSLCHSMSTISTGGFSTKQESIAAFDSPKIEYVTTL